jgi:hypothetical protein
MALLSLVLGHHGASGFGHAPTAEEVTAQAEHLWTVSEAILARL